MVKLDPYKYLPIGKFEITSCSGRSPGCYAVTSKSLDGQCCVSVYGLPAREIPGFRLRPSIVDGYAHSLELKPERGISMAEKVRETIANLSNSADGLQRTWKRTDKRSPHGRS